ncbi:cation efflux system protein (plasmid) [Leptolyngbya boryana NIES-2135]|jgi:CzcA family heavy metal efflux pump|uniref:Cation efflux system protein n=1 Tax=Leptolyngbya boryana NIES-2135 TaxID=1973484 RepID=A0A1Z4JRG7_LEPBY|nr:MULTISPECIES: CusA/CzcA family heavy metal efflux RND transporter [Leptolyngbya]BAY59355.1 cation efflux system protein [Leptolyngbya boryana NIES-2135]MBD2372943.1 CusA/CzcA family heavy metal efflux RND transporter [Leptolyngbya sp. FACHB-238]MBD2397304.1 CusA/CzcA family heavy metal efflux RND transporter [Leptolyngbya sp. FACHB-239]MBD2403891.1 CusA/CzcA family heavy metal efflux RND transporter [Leptolyngbya sp. FACHB-402]ULP33187.1 CusA/CzcA family heavy metal efflux RND transporter [
MLNSIVKWSIAQRWLVVLASILVSVWGFLNLSQMPLDVFPSFAPPQVEIQAEAPGLAPEEVEALVTRPIESAINGTPGLDSLRSSSAVGLSAVRATFKWDTEIYRARQLVAERLQQVRGQLPQGVNDPEILPISSPLAWTVKYAFTSEATPLMEVWRIVNWQVKNRLLAVPGVSNVVIFGGDERQYQVLINPDKLKAFNVTLDDVVKATSAANSNAPGGFLITRDEETVVRGVGRVESVEQLKRSVIKAKDGKPILLEQVADVQIGSALKRGDGSFAGKKAVVLTVNKQPTADTPAVTKAVEAALEELKESLPKDVKIATTFRQEDFIEASLKNVEEALRDGTIIVSVVLILFLMNWRTVVISLSALPVSLLLGMLILNWTGQGINTMTLGGLVVAIGSVVDDAIVDMENVYRRLRENQLSDNPRNPFQVVFDGSVEVRVSVLFATVIIAVVFAPIFALSGVEGRIFTPMGVAYLLCIFASTLVALTLTPAMCALLLVNRRLPSTETWLEHKAQQLYRPALRFSIRHPKTIIVGSLAAFAASLVILTGVGQVFLPEFNDRALVIAATLYPGSSLEETNQTGLVLEQALAGNPNFETVQFRSGRAQGDVEVAGTNSGELDVQLSEEGAKDREKSIEQIREEFKRIPGVASNIGGFISHRMDEVLSGVRSAIAVKIFGPDLDQLRTLGQQVQSAMGEVKGLTDLQLEPQVPVKQLQIEFDRDAAARYGITIGELSDLVETGLNGKVVSQVLENQQTFDLVVWFQEPYRNSIDVIRNLLVDTPNGQKVPLAQVAKVDNGKGPNTINRENVSRYIVISSNVAGRDLGSAIQEIRTKVKQNVQLPAGYYVEYGGQFEAQEGATKTLLLTGAVALVAIAVLLYFAVKSIPATMMILANLPLALVGGVLSIALTGGILSVASMVGFITLFGVAARNGLLLVENYNQRLAQGQPLKEVLVEGSLERLVAILMTAFSSALGMVPLTLGSGAGKEILQPLAIVVLGGLFTSTALTLLVLPALYSLFNRWIVPKTPTHLIQDHPPDSSYANPGVPNS